tara:strand:- start:8895 stop:8996 length:102 start_codon:yes stop_codon:yes gene_type:complete
MEIIIFLCTLALGIVFVLYTEMNKAKKDHEEKD